METEEERSPEETMQEKLFEQIPETGDDNDEENEEDEEERQNDQSANLVSGDEFQKRADEIKLQQEKLKAPKIIDTAEGNDEGRAAAA